jgi:hypothetical protein
MIYFFKSKTAPANLHLFLPETTPILYLFSFVSLLVSVRLLTSKNDIKNTLFNLIELKPSKLIETIHIKNDGIKRNLFLKKHDFMLNEKYICSFKNIFADCAVFEKLVICLFYNQHFVKTSFAICLKLKDRLLSFTR